MEENGEERRGRMQCFLFTAVDQDCSSFVLEHSEDLSEASRSEDPQVVRCRLRQDLDTSNAMAFLAYSRIAVILLIEALFRVTPGANLPFAAHTYS